MKRLIILLFAVVAGCGGTPPLGGSSNVQVIAGDALPAPTRGDQVNVDRPYLIGPYDRLAIDVFGIEELSKKEVQTDGSGRISFPLAGVIEAGGMTPTQLQQELTSRLLAAHIRNPQVAVNLVETKSQVVTVDGQVARPGLYPVLGKMTLMRAIATAQGTSEFAKLDDVVVFRTVQGQKLAALYNLGAIRRGAYDDPEVYANDVVVVGDSKARRLFRDLIQAAPLLSTPLIVALQGNGA